MRSLDLVRRLSTVVFVAAALAGCDGPARAPVEARIDPPAAVHDSGSQENEAGIEVTRTHGGAILATVVPVRVRPVTSVARGEVAIRRAVVAREVVEHEPVGASDTFDVPGVSPLYLFLDVRNDESRDEALTVVFVRTDLADARERGGVVLSVPASARRYRTWAYSRQIREAGAWAAIVRDESGRELTRVRFTVVARQPAAV